MEQIGETIYYQETLGLILRTNISCKQSINKYFSRLVCSILYNAWRKERAEVGEVVKSSFDPAMNVTYNRRPPA